MISVGLGTTSLYPQKLDTIFGVAKDVGYDGIEVMITHQEETRIPQNLERLQRIHQLPILSLHAPTLLLTHFAWSRSPVEKLRKTANLAADLGIPTVVVHPPYAWQKEYASQFINVVQETESSTGVKVAVENMFPWRIKGRKIRAYAPSFEYLAQNCKNLTVDFSHAALSGDNSLEMVSTHLQRLGHIHLCDGNSIKVNGKDRIMDEHALPGKGNQPVAQTLQFLASKNWDGSVVAEINTRKYRGLAAKMDALKYTLEFARKNLAPVNTKASSRVNSGLISVA